MERSYEKLAFTIAKKCLGINLLKKAGENDTETFQTLKMFRKGLGGARLPS